MNLNTSGAPLASELMTTITAATGFTSAIYNRSDKPVELLTNGILASGTGWTRTGDFALTANAATYTDSSNAGTVSQAVTALAKTGRSGGKYRFTYTVSATGAHVAAEISITTAFAKVATPLVHLDTDGTYFVDFIAADTPGAFTLSGTSAAETHVTLDDLSLLELEHIPWLQPHHALVTVRTASIIFTLDGTTPTTLASTANYGNQADAGQSFVLSSIEEIKQFRCINSVASNGAIVFATFYY